MTIEHETVLKQIARDKVMDRIRITKPYVKFTEDEVIIQRIAPSVPLAPIERKIVVFFQKTFSKTLCCHVNKEVATYLGGSKQTAKNHIHHIFSKIGVDHAYQLIFIRL